MLSLKGMSLVGLLCMLVAFVANAQKLSNVEQAVVRIIERDREESIGFLKKVVDINSGTMNQKGVRAVGKAFAEAFQEIGFTTRWITMPTEVNRAGHLFAERKGDRGKRVLIIGHLDTVFEEDSPFQTFERRDTLGIGPGASDMKGGDVVVLYALRALQEVGALEHAQIIIAFTGDEEHPGTPTTISRSDLVEAAKRSDVALGFETSTGFPYATVARRGWSEWTLEVSGTKAHSAGIFDEGVGAGAIFEFARILHRFYDEIRGEEYLTFSPALVLGGDRMEYNDSLELGTASGKLNIVAQTALVKGDLRFISDVQKERIRENMRRVVSDHLPGTSATISFKDVNPAMPPTEGNRRLLELLSQASQDLGQGKVEAWNPGWRGAGDISFIAQYADCLDGLGAMGSGTHSMHESVDLQTIDDLTRRAAILIYRLTSE
jgi:glutamate carboxypeptidase